MEQDSIQHEQPLQRTCEALADEFESTLLPAEEAEEVLSSERQALSDREEGQTAALIDSRWWNEWTSFSGLVEDGLEEVVAPSSLTARPGPIDNSGLMTEELDETSGLGETSKVELRQSLGEGKDYVLKSKPTWEKLQRWHGGGPAILREYVRDGTSSAKLVVDVYPLKLKVFRSSKPEEVSLLTISRLATVGDLKAKCCQVLGVEEVDVRLWDYYNNARYALLDNRLSESVDNAKLVENQVLQLEEKVDDKFDADPSSPPGLSFLMRPSSRTLQTSYMYRPEDSVDAAPGKERGLAGLANLGNTCFMNSSLQCLAHTVPLERLFLNGMYKQMLNRDNPLGCRGELAEAFGGLMDKLWQGGVRSVAPRAFKQQLAKFAGQFAGYQQQDAQELLAFLLDGLHEDLNVVKQKRFIEESDYKGQPDEEWAAEAVSNWRANNDSAVLDAFQGLYKSTLICPNCQGVHVKFDPVMYLTLPIPNTRTTTLEVVVVQADGSSGPVQYAVTLPADSRVGELYTSLGEVLGLDENEEAKDVLLLVDVSWHKVNDKLIDMTDPLPTPGKHRHIICYQYPSKSSGPHSGGVEVHLMHRRVQKGSYTSKSAFAAPLVLFMPLEEVRSMELNEVAELSQLSSSSGTEYVVSPTAPLAAALEAALRPFRSMPNPAFGLANGVPSSSAQSAADGGEHASITGNGLVEDAAAKGAVPNGVHMNGIAMSPAASTVRADVEDGFAPSVPASEPFNMWQQQEADEAMNDALCPSSPVSSSGVEQEPYSIKVSGRYGETVLSSLPGRAADATLVQHFVVDWKQPGGKAAYDLALLEEPAQDESMERAKQQPRTGAQPVALTSCLEAHLKPEKLDEDNSWYCPRCKAHVQAEKKLDLWALPECLVVHLKRFSHSRLWRNKIDTPVEFPLRGLDLSAQTLRQQDIAPLYDLYGVVNHFGSLGGGHYTAYCKMARGWYCFDDSQVSGPMQEEAVESSSAYLLFYRRGHAEAEVDVDMGGMDQADGCVDAADGMVSLEDTNGLPDHSSAVGVGAVPKQAKVQTPVTPALHSAGSAAHIL